MSDWFASCEGHKVKVAADLVCMYKSSLHILFEIVVLQGSMRRHWLLKTLTRRGLAAWQAWHSKAIVLPGLVLPLVIERGARVRGANIADKVLLYLVSYIFHHKGIFAVAFVHTRYPVSLQAKSGMRFCNLQRS